MGREALLCHVLGIEVHGAVLGSRQREVELRRRSAAYLTEASERAKTVVGLEPQAVCLLN